MLESAAELSQIPRLLGRKDKAVQIRPALWETMDPGKLRELLLRTDSFSEAIRVKRNLHICQELCQPRKCRLPTPSWIFNPGR